MRITNHGTSVTVDVTPEEYVVLLRPGSMLNSVSQNIPGRRVGQRKVGGVIVLPIDAIPIIMAMDPKHALDLALKRGLASQRYVAA